MKQKALPIWCFAVMSCIVSWGAVNAETKTITLPPETAQLKPSDLPGYPIARAKCAICHSADYIEYQPPQMTLTQWTAEVQKMQHSYGAPIDADEIKLISSYLASTYGDASTVDPGDRHRN